jgi:hypothetical protein
VETLLLRWTLMDQVVDLEQVLATLGGGGRTSPVARREPPRPESLRTMKDSVPPTVPGPAAPRTPRDASAAVAEPSPIQAIPFTVAAFERAWPEIVIAARKESPFLGEALGAARPIEAAAPALTVELLDPNPLITERLTRQRDLVQALLSRFVGAPVALVLGSGSPSPGESAPDRPKRMSDAGARAERLKTLRKKDAALDAAADELDLEIVD